MRIESLARTGLHSESILKWGAKGHIESLCNMGTVNITQ